MSSSSISKIIPSLASAAPELTLALANFNLDFTLYKASAPPEYQGLGNSLSHRRKAAAEDGHEHIVARKLTRLFFNHVPDVPFLLAAYGERASRVASAAGRSEKSIMSFGVFADHAGLDGTSIWAAATSSREALCLHLLACMLARIWSGPQAISIWVEIVEERQKELLKLRQDDPLHLSEIAAARLELDRADLAAWDASARSWLGIADGVMKREQSQFLLMVDRTTLPVDLSTGVYRNVMTAWRTALSTVDKICNGMSYEIQNGSVLLGLASWHLFPDMFVLYEGHHKRIKQSDSVIPRAGILTFGLERHEAGGHVCEDTEGLRWSLPLSHLRFYGDPVIVKQIMGTGSLRLSLADFHLVVLGCFLARWGHHAHDLFEAAKLVSTVWQFLSPEDHTESNLSSPTIDHEVARFPRRDSWLRILADAAETLLSSEDLNGQIAIRLVERGYRRFETFLAPAPIQPEPMFELGTLDSLIPLLHEEGVINVLRRYVSTTGLDPSDIIIRYRHTTTAAERLIRSTEDTTKQDGVKSRMHDVSLPIIEEVKQSTLYAREGRSNPMWQPFHTSIDDDGATESKTTFMFDFLDEAVVDQDFLGSRVENTKRNMDEDSHIIEDQRDRKRPRTSSYSNSLGPKINESFYEYATALPAITGDATGRHTRWYRKGLGDEGSHRLANTRTSDDIQYYSRKEIIEIDEKHFRWSSGDDVSEETYEIHQDHFSYHRHYTFLAGHPTIGAIFRKVDSTAEVQDALEVGEVKDAFKARDIEPRAFLVHLSKLGGQQRRDRNSHKSSRLVRSLRGVAAATAVYKIMPNAMITTGIFQKPLYEAMWVHEDVPSFTRSGTSIATHERPYFPEDDLNMANFGNLPRSTHQNEFEWLMKFTLDRTRTFACIAMFENAAINADPDGLQEVMALSVGNSIYVAMPLLCDPYDEPVAHEMKHVVGNVGQPGITFLIPPAAPMVRKNDGWEAGADHDFFTGSLKDNFQSTSLHLSFTKFSFPLGQTNEGGQDVEACFRETLIRLHGPDGRWFADLDILGARKSPLFKRTENPRLKNCGHNRDRRMKPHARLKSIDSWPAFLDRPRIPGVVRATGNWLARLAAATLNVQLGYPVIVLPDGMDCYHLEGEEETEEKDKVEKLCWACVLSNTAVVGRSRNNTLGHRDQNTYDPAYMPFFIA